MLLSPLGFPRGLHPAPKSEPNASPLPPESNLLLSVTLEILLKVSYSLFLYIQPLCLLEGEGWSQETFQGNRTEWTVSCVF